MPDFSPTELAVPGFVALVLIEMIWARRKRREAYEPKDTLTSLAFGLGSTVSGLIFGAGLALAGMTDPAVVLGFLDVAGAWNPALAFVMGGAVIVTFAGYRLVRRRGRVYIINKVDKRYKARQG